MVRKQQRAMTMKETVMDPPRPKERKKGKKEKGHWKNEHVLFARKFYPGPLKCMLI
jgi:hypothetical protein